MVRAFLLCLFFFHGPAAADSYRIQPGDSLLLEVMEDPDMRRSVLVLPDGTVSVPLVGTIGAAGSTVGEVEARILDAIRPNYVTTPHLTVSVSSLAKPKRQERARPAAQALRAGAVAPQTSTMAVFAMGELGKPGKLHVTPGTTLLQLLAQAGGFTRFAAPKRVVLQRLDRKSGAQKSYKLNAKAMMAGGAGAVLLQPGDVIVVPERRLFE